MVTPRPSVDTTDIWARLEEFDNSFKRLLEIAAEKFADVDVSGEEESESIVDCPGVSPDAQRVTDLSGVHVLESAEMGRVLVTTRCFNCHDLILTETPALILHQSALSSVSKLRQAAAELPPHLDLTGYEDHMGSVPSQVVDKAEGDPDAVRLYMVFRINGMQWGRHHVAVCEVASKAPHSCAPNAVFGQCKADNETNKQNTAIVPPGTAHLEVRAARSLAEDEQVSLDYLDDPDDLLCPTSVRRRILHSQRFFVCHCWRCLEAEGDAGDPCRGFRCACGDVIRPRSVAAGYLTLDDDVRRARRFEIPACEVVGSSCSSCGRQGIEQSLLSLESELAAELGSVLETMGDSSVANLVLTVEVNGGNPNFDIFETIERLYLRARALAPHHWLACRTSLLSWQALLAKAVLRGGDVAECSLLEESVSFIEACCPLLIPTLVGRWIVEAARHLYELEPWRSLVVYPVFEKIHGLEGVRFESSEMWYSFFLHQASIELSDMD